MLYRFCAQFIECDLWLFCHRARVSQGTRSVLALRAPLSLLAIGKPTSDRPAQRFPSLRGWVVSSPPTTTDVPSSGLIFRLICHSMLSSSTTRVQTRMIPV